MNSNQASPLVLAVGAVFLLTWYGVRRVRGGRVHLEPPPGSPPRPADEPDGYRERALTALQAEFRDREEARARYLAAGGAVECEECGAIHPAGTLYCECGGETCELDEDEPPRERDERQEEETETARDTSAADPTREEDEGDPEELVVVHIAENHWKASLLKSYLESNGIPCMTGGNVPSIVYQFNFTPLGEVRLYVHRFHAREARALLAEAT